MSKRPAFQFYPSDWRNDAGLRLCSAGARGLWVDMLCLMHDGEPYGHLTVLGRGMSADALAKLVGESAPAVKRWLAELASNDVYSFTDAGLIFSRRMVRDEALRDIRAAGGQAGGAHGGKGGSHGVKGGRPKKDEGGSDGDTRGDNKPPLKPPPSSSSSSPSSKGSDEVRTSSAPDGGERDFDKLAWMEAVALLTEGGMPLKSARSFFGSLLADNRIAARDMLGSLSGVTAQTSQDPKAYLAAAARKIGERQQPEKKRVGFV